MKVKEIQCKSALRPSKIQNHVINPYFGCQHGCKYCYAKIYTFGHEKEEWGTFVDVRINLIDKLKKQLKKIKQGSIWFSSICDPYQPIESRYKLTQKCLKVLLNWGDSVCIQTKSDLVLRDLDLLKKLKDVEIGFTITILDDDLAKVWEPGASLPSKRLRALEELKQKGIKTYIFFGPILPYFSDSEDKILEAFKKFNQVGVNEVLVDKIRHLQDKVGRELREFVLEKYGKGIWSHFEHAQGLEYQEKLRLKIEHVLRYFDIKYKLLF